MGRVLKKLNLFSEVVKLPHTVFALPFAFTGALMAAQGIPSLRLLFWVGMAMVGARSGAMAFNRWADATIDAANPRTRNRPIPRGVVGKRGVLLFSLVSYALLIFAAWQLNFLCFKLSPLAVVITALYSYTKRFTWATHMVLGLSLSMAPLGAWIAVRGKIDLPGLFLGFAVLFWVAGFDILYALQDVDFDRSFGLHSIPRYLGVATSLYLARLFHGFTFLLLIGTGWACTMGCLYWLGLIVVLVLFAYEHSLIKPKDLSKLDMAFFNMNGYISLTVFLFTLFDFLI
jgi:4-hydroxybenzoate polyprenyltransferase